MYKVEKRDEKTGNLIAILHTAQDLQEAKALLNTTATRIGRRLGSLDDCYSYKDQPNYLKPANNILVGIFMDGKRVILHEQPN